MKRVVWLAGLLTALILVLVPMAWASPIDPSWIKGVYDNPGLAQVVTYLKAFLIALPIPLVHELPRNLVVVQADPLVDETYPAAPAATPHPPRAPPLH